MLIELVIAVVIYIAYKYVFSSWRKYNKFCKLVESLGYKVYKFPFNPLGLQLYLLNLKDKKEHKDGIYTVKREYYGYDLAVCGIFDTIIIELINPELLKDFYNSNKIEMYQKSYFLGLMKQLLGEGIFFSENQEWRRRRTNFNKTFTFQFVKGLIPGINKIVTKNFDELQTKSQYPNSINVAGLMTKIFTQITTTQFFGRLLEKEIEGQTLEVLFCKAINDAGKMPSFAPEISLFGLWLVKLKYRKQFRDLYKCIQAFRRESTLFIQQCISQIQSNPNYNPQKPTNILEILYGLNKQSKLEKQQYSINDMVSQFANLYLAGAETTSHLNTMMIYYLDMNPKCKQKAYEQIDRLVKDQNDLNNLEVLKSLKYIQAIQNQALRMYGPVNRILPRDAAKDHLLKNIPISKGTIIIPSSVGVHHNPKYFQNPLQFIPERWMDESFQKSLPSFVFVAFSGGPRHCLGKQLALLQSKICLAKFLKRYNYKMKTHDFVLHYDFVYEPDKVPLEISRRS